MIDLKLDKFYKAMYVLILFVMIGVVAYITITFSTNKYSRHDKESSIVIEHWDVYNDAGVYLGNSSTAVINAGPHEVIILKQKIPVSTPYDYCIGFYSNNLDVYVYVEDTLLYEFSQGENAFGNTAGNGYHVIPHIYEYTDKFVEIHISSPYGITSLPGVEFASAQTLYSNQIAMTTMPFAIAIITLIVGLLLLFYGIYNQVKGSTNKSFLFLGLFAMTLAIYTGTKQSVFLILMNNHVMVSYLSYIALMLMPIPFILFIKELFVNKTHLIWYTLLTLHLVNILATTILQIFDKANFADTLAGTHMFYTITIIALICMTFYELFRYKWTASMKLTILYILVFILFVIEDLNTSYIFTEGDGPFIGTIAFLVCILIASFYSIKSSTTLIVKGQQAEKYKTLAFKDKLTGLGNRTAHDACLENADIYSHSYIIFDLNNLKYYNDNLGHDAGDRYITQSANMIKEAFGELSNYQCYRTGGDEFCAIIEDKTIEQFQVAYEHFNSLMDSFNATSGKLKIHIATGYAEFNPSIDYSLKRTKNRADNMMYKNKALLKEKYGSPAQL